PERFPTVSGVGGSNRAPTAGPFQIDWQWRGASIERNVGQVRVTVDGSYLGSGRGHLSLRDLQLVWGSRAIRPDPNLSGLQFQQRNGTIVPGTEFDVEPRSDFTVLLVFLEVPSGDSDLRLNGLPGIPSLPVR